MRIDIYPRMGISVDFVPTFGIAALVLMFLSGEELLNYAGQIEIAIPIAEGNFYGIAEYL